jgi:hypothetical protein
MGIDITKLMTFVQDTIKQADKKVPIPEKKIVQESRILLEDLNEGETSILPTDREVFAFNFIGNGQELLGHVQNNLDTMELNREDVPREGAKIFIEGETTFKGDKVQVASVWLGNAPSNKHHLLIYDRNPQSQWENKVEEEETVLENVVCQCKECGEVLENVSECTCGCKELEQIYPIPEGKEIKEEEKSGSYSVKDKEGNVYATNLTFQEAHDFVQDAKTQVKQKGGFVITSESISEAYDTITPSTNTVGMEKDVRKVVAKGITDKQDAENVARSKRGKVVSDEDDPKKFMVVVGESIHPGVTARKIERLLRGETVKVDDEGLDEIEKNLPEDVVNNLRSIINKKKIGTKDKYIASLSKIGESKLNEDPSTFIKKLSPNAKVTVSTSGSKITITSDLGSIVVWKGVTDGVWRSKLGEGDVDKYTDLTSALEDSLKAVDSNYSRKEFKRLKDIAKEGEDVEESRLNEERQTFISPVDVTLNITDLPNEQIEDYDILTRKVDLNYGLDIEYRSWGIKNIDPTFDTGVTISWQDASGEHDVDVTADILRDADIWWEESGFYGPTSLEVSVDSKGVVSNVQIWFSYIKH